MFKINLASFGDFAEFSEELKKGDAVFDGIDYDDNFKIDINATKDGTESVIIEGAINGKVNLTCGRCLENISQPIDTEFTVIFRKKSAITGDDAQTDVRSYVNNEIDLHECLYETIMLEIPLKPLCSQDCRGLCPVCGINKNKEKCSCSLEPGNAETYKPFKGLDLQ
jgi:uncharacterized metal-binding protein YceD (DUF177 family)